MSSTFLFTDLSNAVVSASSINTDYPVSNLLDYNNQSKWCANEVDTDMWVRFSFPSAIVVSRIVIDNHNFDSVMESGSIQLQHANDEDFTSGVTTVITYSTTNTDVILVDIDSVTKRYWRIYYSGLCAVEPYIGNVYFGIPIELPYYSWGYSKDNKEYYTVSGVSLDGCIITNQPYEGRLLYNLNFKFITDDIKDDFVNFVNTVRGKLFPFYFTDHENVTRYIKFAEDYTPALVRSWKLNEIQTLNMKAFDVGFTSSEVILLKDMFGIYEDERINSVTNTIE